MPTRMVLKKNTFNGKNRRLKKTGDSPVFFAASRKKIPSRGYDQSVLIVSLIDLSATLLLPGQYSQIQIHFRFEGRQRSMSLYGFYPPVSAWKARS
jgi:hypothetical protein